MAIMNWLFCGLHIYVFVLALLITLSAWGSRLRWIGLAITLMAFPFTLTPFFNPIWIADLQLPGKVIILIGALVITFLTKRSDTRHIGVLRVVAAGGTVLAQMLTF